MEQQQKPAPPVLNVGEAVTVADGLFTVEGLIVEAVTACAQGGYNVRVMPAKVVHGGS